MYTYTYPHHGKEWEGGVLRKKYSPNLRFVVLESLSETEMQHILLHSGSTLFDAKNRTRRETSNSYTCEKPNPPFFLVGR